MALQQAARSRLWRVDSEGALRLLDELGVEAGATAEVRDLRARASLVEAGRRQVSGRSVEAAELYRIATGRELGSDPTADLAETLIAEGHIDTAISVLSDGLLRQPGNPHLSALMERALAVRYPDPLP